MQVIQCPAQTYNEIRGQVENAEKQACGAELRQVELGLWTVAGQEGRSVAKARRGRRIAAGVRRARRRPRHSGVPERLKWRQAMVSSELYGRSRHLHMEADEEAHGKDQA